MIVLSKNNCVHVCVHDHISTEGEIDKADIENIYQPASTCPSTARNYITTAYLLIHILLDTFN